MKELLEKIIYENNKKGADHKEFLLSGKELPSARVAIYDSLRALPRIVELSDEDLSQFTNLLSTKTYQLSQSKGGKIPFTIIKEVVENLIHAYFKEVIVTILDEGNTIRISDQGPGIKDKRRAFEPGFSTATKTMKKLIKGVGSGLPIVKETLSFVGGNITIEDNLEEGTVITLRMPEEVPRLETPPSFKNKAKESPEFKLSERQKKILFLVTEIGAIGPSRIVQELEIGLSTAYRDLLYLEEQNLIKSDGQGKRSLTSKGIKYLDMILKSL